MKKGAVAQSVLGIARGLFGVLLLLGMCVLL